MIFNDMKEGKYEIQDRGLIERNENWRSIRRQIPFIRFKENWQVRIMPPYCGAVARFEVKETSSDILCSVYLDWFGATGYFDGNPFWEVHTLDNGEPERFDLDDTSGIVDCIDRKLKAANSETKED